MRRILPIFIFMILTLTAFAGSSGLPEDGGSPFLKEFSVYPNPTNGALTVSMETFGETTEMQLKVFSLIGQEMYTETITPFSGMKRISLDLTKLPKGIYMIEVSDGEKSRIKRVSVI